MSADFIRHLALAGIAAAILGGVLWYLASHPAPDASPAGTGTTTPLGGAEEPAVIREDAAYYEVEARYPNAVAFPLSSRSDAGAGAQAAMKQWVVQAVAEFKASAGFESLTPEDVRTLGLGEDRKYTLGIDYRAYESRRTRSYVFTENVYTGGAHGNTTYRTFTFDATTSGELSLADLFAPGADYAAELSAIARADLPGVIGEYADASFIDAGTAPVPGNFENFYLDGSRLVILFPPYQVGPYALGPVSLPIELSRLSSILRPEFK